MDSLMNIYRQRITVPVGAVNGRMGFKDEDHYSSHSDSENENDDKTVYEEEFVKEEMNKYYRFSSKDEVNSFDGLSEVDDSEFYQKVTLNVYSSYNFTSTFLKRELPIDAFKEKIVALSNINNVVVIQGPTGCGKTTQVPQYILDHCRTQGKLCNIVVTQPRKIATINIARRVCEERGWTLGTVCGYQVGLERKTSPDCLITYVTTGVLLQKLIRAKSLHEFTHIVIDEIHERDQDLDFLLLVVRKFLFTNSPNTKVILMSATIEAEDFANYFRYQNQATYISAPIVRVDKQSQFTTQIYYIESFQSFGTLSKFDLEKPEIAETTYKVFLFLVTALDNIDEEDAVTKARRIGSVLVFLPGINEIEEANKVLTNQNRKGAKDIKWDIVPLHSSLPNDEQAKVFYNQRPGYRKIILSTNIAESSITVPDSCYVIDFCLTKVLTIDSYTKFVSLKLEWASHVNCEQRAGRVGRVANGRVYRLVPSDFYRNKMPKKGTPEIMRAPLDSVVLKSKMLNLDETPKQILALAINPPNLKNIESTIWHLKETGALLQTARGVHTAVDGDLTFLGQVMGSLPIDIHLSKLIVLGHMFSCFPEAVIIAAGCSIQNIFSIPFQQAFPAYEKKLVWADGSCSDMIALLNLFNVWTSYKRDNVLSSTQTEHRWCALNLVSLKGLKEWTVLITEIKQRLAHLKIEEITGPNKVILQAQQKPLMLKIITCGAFYPNYFIRTPVTNQEREAVKIVGGRDPYRTVYFTGMDPSQPGQLYVRALKKFFSKEEKLSDNLYVGFDASSKIYIEFKREEEQPFTVNVDGQQMLAKIPGKIPLAVYEALRRRQLRFSFYLDLIPPKEAWEFAEKHGISRQQTMSTSSVFEDVNCFSEVSYSPLPTLDTEYIEIVITHKTDAGHFWSQNFNKESTEILHKIGRGINGQILRPVVPKGKCITVPQGAFYAAKFHEDNQFYRCKVIAQRDKELTVLFIDYGNTQSIYVDHLFHLPQIPECHVDPLAIECVLTGVKPSLRTNPNGVWSQEVNDFFTRQTQNVVLYGKVFSVVDNVVSVELFRSNVRQQQQQQTKSLNQYLIEKGYAEKSEESYLSKEDNERRMAARSAGHVIVSVDKLRSYSDFEAPTKIKPYMRIQLKGPYSPLEMKIYGLTESSGNKAAEIEGSSVNTVLLDNEPEDPHTRLVVAAYVGQTPSGNRLLLRQTTVTPDLPGFPMLMALLFCPMMDPKPVEDGTRIASILCGLGFNQITGKARFPSHDINIVLDTDLKADEIEEINKLRYMMNNGIKIMEDISKEMAYEDDLLSCQNELKNSLMKLVYRERETVEPVNVRFASVWSRYVYDATILKPDSSEDPEHIWPLLWFAKLQTRENYDPLIQNNLEEMDHICRSMIPEKTIKCQLCDVTLSTAYGVRMHVISTTHEQNLERYKFNIEISDDEQDAENMETAG